VICPSFEFFIPGEKGQIFPDSPLGTLLLSGNCADFSNKIRGPGLSPGSEPTIGDYFSAARTFLENGDCHVLKAALSASVGKGQDFPSIKGVELYLEKHGAFYHPLRVKVFTQTSPVSFVLNGAVSGPGLALIETEYQLLGRLEKLTTPPYTPRVFAAGIQGFEIFNTKEMNPIDSGSEKRKVGFFLGEWFEGFREFHISNRDGETKIAVWASNGDVEYLSLERASTLYEQIAYILTTYYNLDTGEQIFPWHHAAGDFVVNLLEEGFPVKLITVRGYASLMECDPDGTGEHLLPSLLFFFLNLTMRIQMDRLDGVGPLVFLGEGVLEATITGFLRGLDDKARKKSNQDNSAPALAQGRASGLGKIFVSFMAGFSREQIEAILENLIEAWPGNASDQAMARAHLKSHSACVHSEFKNR
jgi:hypothetical protein